MTWNRQTESPGRCLGVLVNGHGVVVDLYWNMPTEVQRAPTDQCARP